MTTAPPVTTPHPDLRVIHSARDLTGQPPLIDIISVFHDEQTMNEVADLHDTLHQEHGADVTLIAVSNMTNNRGFAKACNLGAAHGRGQIIGFLNPDVVITGGWVGPVHRAFDRDPHLAVAGNRFGKPTRELKLWGVKEWVCGAAMFVRRSWWELVSGFDEQFVWAWEETDLIRRTEQAGLGVRDLKLPIEHEVKGEDSDYKRTHFERGRQLYRAKHNLPNA